MRAVEDDEAVEMMRVRVEETGSRPDQLRNVAAFSG